MCFPLNPFLPPRQLTCSPFAHCSLKELSTPNPGLGGLISSPLAALRKESRQQRKYAAFVHEQPAALAELSTAILEDRKGRFANHTQAWQATDPIQAPTPSQHFQTLRKLVVSPARDAHLQAIRYLNQAILDECSSRRTSMHSKASSSHELLSTPSHAGSQTDVFAMSPQLNPPSDDNHDSLSVTPSMIAQRGHAPSLPITPLPLAFASSSPSSNVSNISMTSTASFSSVDSDFTSKLERHTGSCHHLSCFIMAHLLTTAPIQVTELLAWSSRKRKLFSLLP